MDETPIGRLPPPAPSLFHRAALRARTASLVDLDPGLFEGLGPRDLVGIREIAAHVAQLGTGRWEPRIEGVETGLGLLVLDGLLARTVAIDREVVTELVGPGDLIRPWEAPDDVIVPCPVGWIVLEEARVAMLGRQVAAAAKDSPALVSALLERTVRRTRSQGILGAIAHLKRIDLRVLLLLWHVAERWGRVTPQGVVVPLRLTHVRIALLVGAQRPSVTAALSRMSAEGVVIRNDARGYVLTSRAREQLEALCGGGEAAVTPLAEPAAS